MSDIIRVQWTIVPRSVAPQPWLNCKRCRDSRPFRSSGKIRVNANGKRLDAWLIYKCTSCNSTWKRPVLERRPIRMIDPHFLMSLHANDPELAHRLALDVEGLRRKAGLAEASDDVVVRKQVLSESLTPARRLELLLAIPAATELQMTGLRLDRLLAVGLQLSRRRIRTLQDMGHLAVFPEASRKRHSAVRDGMRVTIELSELDDRDGIAMAAKGSSPVAQHGVGRITPS